MKKLIIPLIAFLMFSASCERTLKESEVPQAVKDAVKAKYPSAVITEWELESKDVYSATFKSDEGEMESYFKADGTFIKEEKE